jgi:hypothetical protein
MIKIYLLSFANGKKYVGQTKNDPELRPSQYRSRLAHTVGGALMQEPNPTISIIYKCEDSMANILEQKAIIGFNSQYPNGLNIAHGGGVNREIRTTAERIHIRAEKILAQKGAKEARKEKAFLRKQLPKISTSKQQWHMETAKYLACKYPKK